MHLKWNSSMYCEQWLCIAMYGSVSYYVWLCIAMVMLIM